MYWQSFTWSIGKDRIRNRDRNNFSEEEFLDKTKGISNLDYEFINKINSLIKNSFGHSYKGNYHIGTNGLDKIRYQDHKENSLEFIARPLPFINPQLGFGIAGLLGLGEINNSSSDGSILAIRKDKKKYIQAAKKYAKIYKEEFGKDVQIIYVDNFNELTNGKYVVTHSIVPKNFGFKA
jgi:hypothetical protein